MGSRSCAAHAQRAHSEEKEAAARSYAPRVNERKPCAMNTVFVTQPIKTACALAAQPPRAPGVARGRGRAGGESVTVSAPVRNRVANKRPAGAGDAGTRPQTARNGPGSPRLRGLARLCYGWAGRARGREGRRLIAADWHAPLASTATRAPGSSAWHQGRGLRPCSCAREYLTTSCCCTLLSWLKPDATAANCSLTHARALAARGASTLSATSDLSSISSTHCSFMTS